MVLKRIVPSGFHYIPYPSSHDTGSLQLCVWVLRLKALEIQRLRGDKYCLEMIWPVGSVLAHQYLDISIHLELNSTYIAIGEANRYYVCSREQKVLSSKRVLTVHLEGGEKNHRRVTRRQLISDSLSISLFRMTLLARKKKACMNSFDLKRRSSVSHDYRRLRSPIFK